MKTTLEDVARIAGVSAATVSRVLNERSNVAKETREKVIKAAQLCKYESFWQVSAHPTIAIITSSLRFIGYYSEVLSEIEESLRKLEFKMEIIPLVNLDMLDSRQISGAIAIPTREEQTNNWERFSNVPLVCLNTSAQRQINVYSVNSNLEQATKISIEHLHKLGHQRINMVLETDLKRIPWSDKQRLKGFENVVHRLGIAGDASVTYAGEFTSLVSAMGNALQNGCTAFVCSAYGISIQAYHALQLLGCRIPDDVSLIVREEWNITPYLLPRPSFLRLPLKLLAEAAVKKLTGLIQGQSSPPVPDIDYSLIPGTTTAAPPSANRMAERMRRMTWQNDIGNNN